MFKMNLGENSFTADSEEKFAFMVANSIGDSLENNQIAKWQQLTSDERSFFSEIIGSLHEKKC